MPVPRFSAGLGGATDGTRGTPPGKHGLTGIHLCGYYSAVHSSLLSLHNFVIAFEHNGSFAVESAQPPVTVRTGSYNARSFALRCPGRLTVFPPAMPTGRESVTPAMTDAEPTPEQSPAATSDADAPQPAAGVRQSQPDSGLRFRLRRVMDRAGSWLDTPLKQLTVGTAAVMMAGLVSWWLLREAEPPPEQQLRRALALLKNPSDYEARDEAQRIARHLREINLRDPDFAGGPEYVLGMIAFRDGRQADAAEKDPHFLRAIEYLRESEQQALNERYRPQWHYALGISLFEVGNGLQAQQHLEAAIETYPPAKQPASLRLVDVYLDRNELRELRYALQLVDDLLKTGELTGKLRNRCLLQKVRLHLALNDRAAAQAALQKVSDRRSGNLGMRIFRAQTRLAAADTILSRKRVSAVSPAMRALLLSRAEQHYRSALQELRPASQAAGLETTFIARGWYLMGVSAERIARLDPSPQPEKFDTAINYYERTVRKFPQSHEAVVAGLHAGRLLRVARRDEEALAAYRRSLHKVSRPTGFLNRWISLESYRAELLNAWNDWMQRGIYEPAIELSRLMSAVFPEVRSRELSAIAHRDWAEQLEAEWKTEPPGNRARRQRELRRRRRRTGSAYARLAELLKTTDRYAEMLWTSGENYRWGGDFENALKQFTRFVNARPRKQLPLALVRRGRILMHLDRLNEAQEHFQQVLDLHPTDPAAFEARYHLGTCLLERGLPNKAEAVWRNMLALKSLSPEAGEWRRALFALSRQLYHSAKLLNEQAAAARRNNNTDKADELRHQASSRRTEAILKLEEYLGRYPESPEAVEARFLLARALQQQAAIARKRSREADVEVVQNEQRRRSVAMYRRALKEYRQLQSSLLQAQDEKALPSSHRRMLQDCFFDIAHVRYALAEFEQALAAYNSAANRYSSGPEVLLAYLQMSNCNRRLGDPVEARSLLVQAEVILDRLPEDAFEVPRTSLSREEWKQWLHWAKQQQQTNQIETTP